MTFAKRFFHLANVIGCFGEKLYLFCRFCHFSNISPNLDNQIAGFCNFSRFLKEKNCSFFYKLMTFPKWKKRLVNVILTFFVMFSFVVWKSFFLAYSLKLELGFLSSLLSNPNYNFKLETRATHSKHAKSQDGTNHKLKSVTGGRCVQPMQ